MTETLTTDVLVVGAGPAGITNSLFLSRFGIEHILLEKEDFPRDKICGDALGGKVMDILHDLAPSELNNFAADPKNAVIPKGIKFVAPDFTELDVAFPQPKQDHPMGLISKRLIFDKFLFDLRKSSNHSTTFTGSEILKIKREDGRIKTSISLPDGTKRLIISKLIIGADGHRSVVAKNLLPQEQIPKHLSVAVRGYFSNVTGFHPDNFLELHFIKGLLPGYLWIFPLPNNEANVGLGLLASNVHRRKLNVRKEFLKVVENHPHVKARFKNAKLETKVVGWSLPLGSRKQHISGDSTLLTGDAASLIDPFTGEGIGNAMLSAKKAALMAKLALEENDFSAKFLSQYDKWVYDYLWEELNISHKIQRFSRFPLLFNFVVNKIKSNGELKKVLTNMFVDLDLRAQMKSPLYYFKLLFK